MVIRENVPALNVYNILRETQREIKKTMEKVSSGYEINRSADDAAGLGVSESMRSKITEIARCQSNVDEGIAVTNTADGALQEINDMLRRAHELCIEVANGVYTGQEQDAVSDEINRLFEEVDRITASTNFNGIPLFRGKATQAEIPEDPVVSRIYTEYYKPGSIDSLENFGEMDFVSDQTFDRPEAAKKAEIKLTLDDSITDVNGSAGQLAGKSFQLKIDGRTYTYNFNDHTYTFPPASGYYTAEIDVSGSQTVADVLKNLKSDYYGNQFLDDIKLEGNTVTFVAKLTDLSYPIQSDVVNGTSIAPDGNGEAGNQYQIISAEGSSLGRVDSINNQFAYGPTATTTFTLCGGKTGVISAADRDNLVKNTLSVPGVTGNISLADILTNLGSSATYENLGAAIAARIDASTSTDANYDPASHQLTVNISGLSTSSRAYAYIEEHYESSHRDYASVMSGAELNVSVVDTSGTNERVSEAVITIPDSFNLPVSIDVEGYSYFFYDPSLLPSGYPYIETTAYDAIQVSADNAADTILNTIQSRLYSQNNYNVTFERDGNKLTMKANTIGQQLETEVEGVVRTAKPYKNVGGSSRVLMPNTAYQYFEQDASIPLKLPLDAGGNIDKDKLAKTGFKINSTSFEFVNGAPGIRSDYEDVDISGCTTIADVCAALQTTIGSSYTVTADSSDDRTIHIGFKRTTTSNPPTYMDGYHDTDGLFTSSGDDNLTKNFSGGKNVTQASKEIDFSSINSENLDTLLGKGFRITCASCSGEYINVFFCWKNNGEMPDSFTVTDPDTGAERTIHNVAVELSKIHDGGQIVKDIVDQVKPQLKHFTDVRVGDPPTKLVAFDKRYGDVIDVTSGGGLLQAHVLSGLTTNFTYSYDVQEIRRSDITGDRGPQDDEIRLGYNYMDIYVGSEPRAQWITIHLPYLDLETLKLSPPETVDIAGGQDPFDWLNRVDRASDAIVACRARIGADFNRLEHCGAALDDYFESITEAESEIRDADMAKEMEQLIRQNTLAQAAQGMLVQANMLPDRVTQLLK